MINGLEMLPCHVFFVFLFFRCYVRLKKGRVIVETQVDKQIWLHTIYILTYLYIYIDVCTYACVSCVCARIDFTIAPHF